MPCVYKYLTHHYPSDLVLTQEDSRLALMWRILQTPKVSTSSSRHGRGHRLYKSYSMAVKFRSNHAFGHRLKSAFNMAEIHMLNEAFRRQIIDAFLRFWQTKCDHCLVNLCNCIGKFRDLYGFTEEELPLDWFKEAALIAPDPRLGQDCPKHPFTIVYGNGPSGRQAA